MLYCAAKIDENNKVIDTLAVDETDIVDSNGNISDELTTSFANSIRQTTGTWKAAGMFQEGTVPSFRKTQPGIGDNWEPEQQKFYQKQPHSSWVLDSNLDWNSPTPKPNSTTKSIYNEETQAWDLPDQDFMVNNKYYNETSGDPDNSNFLGRIMEE